MYLMYVDESGDPGPRGGNEMFVLTGLVVHESRWADCFAIIKQLRRTLREGYGIRLNGELHANKNIAGRGVLWGRRWPVADRVRLFQLVLESIAQFPSGQTMSICTRKRQAAEKRGRDLHATAWTFLLQRFHNYVEKARGSSGADSGIVIHDRGHEVEVRKLMRKLRVFNYVPSRFGGPSRNLPLSYLIEDPVARNSAHAQFVQIVAKYQGLDGVYEILKPVVLAAAATDDDWGIVRYPRPDQ
jgi:hypothetical protein